MSAGPRVLVVGSGGREHALCWRIVRDRPSVELFAAPGNAGIGQVARLVPIPATDVGALLAWCRRERPDLVVIGPDDPLAAGVVDALVAVGVRAFGPTAAAARIEWSKAWSAEVCAAAGVPTPQSTLFESADAADAFVQQRGTPYVVKADGLARGKGVVVCDSLDETHAAIDRFARRRELGSAGARILLQERLAGPELSVFAISDGRGHRLIGAARDYKRIADGDRGPNTGGMGAYAPVPEAGSRLLEDVETRIVTPVLGELRRRGCPFTGFLYAGLMLTADGPMLIEFNSRLGDPEAQVVLPLLDFDLVAAMEAAVDGRLRETPAMPLDGAAVCVVLASSGYPGRHETGHDISGLDPVERDTLVFHAATVRENGRWSTAGGRVVGVTGLGATVSEARERAYAGARHIRFEGAVHRTDIAAEVA